MTWVMWRQHRQQALAGAGVLAVLGAFMGITGRQIAAAFHDSGLAACLATAAKQCGQLQMTFSNRYNGMQVFIPLYLIIPVLIGMFFGAPLIAREIEHRTHRLAWTQGITRQRWLLGKLLGIGAPVVAASVGLTILSTWWSRPFEAIGSNRFDYGFFDLLGVAPVVYTLFAVALGIALGAALGKVLPAMGATLVGFVAVRYVIEAFARAHYMAPKTVVSAFTGGGSRVRAADWILSQNTIDRAGTIVSHGGGLEVQFVQQHCPGLGAPGAPPAKQAFLACVNKLGLRSVEVFHPANRFWTFQWIELGIFAALSVAAIVYVVWRIKRIG